MVWTGDCLSDGWGDSCAAAEEVDKVDGYGEGEMKLEGWLDLWVGDRHLGFFIRRKVCRKNQ